MTFSHLEPLIALKSKKVNFQFDTLKPVSKKNPVQPVKRVCTVKLNKNLYQVILDYIFLVKFDVS